MRFIAEQSEAELGGRFSVLRLQRRDHVRLGELLARLSSTAPAAERRALLDIYRLVFPHAFAEESVLWPVVRSVVPDGEQLTLKVEREHQQINELVMLLDTLKPDHPDRQQVLDEVVALLGQDVRDEETELLPALQAKLTPKRLRSLGIAWEAVRRTAPTRPHPFVSRRPPGNVLAALPLTLLDRCRDTIDARRFDSHGVSTPMLSALSTGLTRLSHRVEQLPGLGLGEDLSTQRKRHTTTKGLALLGGIAVLTAFMMINAARSRKEQPA